DVQFVGTLYSFGATLSFTVAHASMVRLRMLPGSEELAYRARPNLSLRGIDWPVFAIFGGLATGISFVVILVQNPATRWVGIAWIPFGLVAYAVYRRRFLHAGPSAPVRAPPPLGAGLAPECRRLLGPAAPVHHSADGLDLPSRLA